MVELSPRERLLRTFNGQPVDRVATFDILHNLDLIERLAGRKVDTDNAEDLLCRAARAALDLIRHFAVPDRLEPRTVTDGEGFVYRYEWWTAHIVSRPDWRTTEEIERAVCEDIESIRSDVAAGRVSHRARQHVRLFDENFDYVAEVKEEFKRITGKLGGALMLPPEDVSPVAVATERLGEAPWWYLYADCRKTARRYLDVLTDYQLFFIDAFACPEVCPFTQISVPVGSASGLLYSPRFFREEVIPREKRKIERWKERGYRVMAFLDGYKRPLIDDFLSAGAEEIHPIEPRCGMDVRTLRQGYPELVLGQPIDCTHLLPFGSALDVKEAVNRAIEDAGGRKILIGSTSEIHPRVRVENALAMYEAARSFRV
jgi:uroporphyrinogen-III decarboxylase